MKIVQFCVTANGLGFFISFVQTQDVENTETCLVEFWWLSININIFKCGIGTHTYAYICEYIYTLTVIYTLILPNGRKLDM